MTLNAITGLIEEETLTENDRQEIYDAIEDDAWRLRPMVSNDGERYLAGNNNGMIEHKIAVAAANENGGVLTPKHYEPLVREVAMKAASMYDGNNRAYVEGRAYAQVAYDGFEEVYGTSKEAAAGIVKSIISDTLDNYYVYDGTTAGSKAKDETSNRIAEIREVLSMQTTREMSAYGRVSRLYDKDGDIKEKDARGSVDLYNLFTGKRFRNGKLVQSKPLADEWWAETHPGEEKPKGGLVFYEHAKDFAEWLQPRVEREAEGYRESWQKAALHECLRRLAVARKKNPDMTWAGEMKIIRDVANLNPESEGGEKMMWESHITPDDVRRMRQQHVDGYKALEGTDFDKETRGVREKIEEMQEVSGKQKAAAEEAKQKRKAEEAAQKKERAEREKIEKLQAYTGYDSRIDKKQSRMWKVTASGLDDPDTAAMNKEKHREMRERFHCVPGDRIVASVYRNGKRYEYYVVGETEDESDLVIGGKGSVAMRGAREKRPPMSGRDEIMYGVVRKKDLPKKFQKNDKTEN